MADPLTDALSVLIAHCPYIRSTRDLVTKIRVELEHGYALELYFREATGQYSYTLLQGNRRVLGWDNAPITPNYRTPHIIFTTKTARPQTRH